MPQGGGQCKSCYWRNRGSYWGLSFLGNQLGARDILALGTERGYNVFGVWRVIFGTEASQGRKGEPRQNYFGS